MREAAITAMLCLSIVLALLLAAGRRRGGGVITAERTPVNPPAPTRLVPLTPREKR